VNSILIIVSLTAIGNFKARYTRIQPKIKVKIHPIWSIAIKRVTKEIEDLAKEILVIQNQPSIRQAAAKQEFERKSANYRTGSMFFILVGGFLVWIGSILGSASNAFTWVLISLLGGGLIALGIYFLIQTLNSVRPTSLTHDEVERLEKLQNLLKKKTSDLESHRNIVDS
jgi:hypothetical protein